MQDLRLGGPGTQSREGRVWDVLVERKCPFTMWPE
jgi:hypothetical protein